VNTPLASVDVLVVGGGINGAGIARDAAGRGLSVVLAEKGDLASATSSASTKLVHGGLRYLEHYEFRLVREALKEREVLLRAAPHIIWPLRFVLPHHRGLRPAWLLRLGLFLYDHLGGRDLLPGTRVIDLDRSPVGTPLKTDYRLGFEYSDCWVEDTRLVVLNAIDARERGAEILTRTALVDARVENGVWLARLQGPDGERTVRARAVVNAAGPWVADVLGGRLGVNSGSAVRLVKGSHVVVPRLYEHDRCYIFQNSDGRIIFTIPYEGAFTLIGTTDEDYKGDPGAAAISEDEIAYLCRLTAEYFQAPVTPADVVWTYSGVRPLYDDGASKAQEATRDYVLEWSETGGAPALSVFGGKITTYRRLAEAAMEHLKRSFPRLGPSWTASAPLPGGDFEPRGVDALVGTAAVGGILSAARHSLRATLSSQISARRARDHPVVEPADLLFCHSQSELGAPPDHVRGPQRPLVVHQVGDLGLGRPGAEGVPELGDRRRVPDHRPDPGPVLSLIHISSPRD
jgi:glycerol-3-phosphate dehydrogenase